MAINKAKGKIQKSKLVEEEMSYSKSTDPLNFLFTLPEKIITFKLSKKVYIIALIAGLLLLGVLKKEWFIAATVNGSPITNFELLSKMNQQFRTQVVNQLVNEKIIADEARKAGIRISDEEISKKLQEIETQVGGAETFNSLLAQQGQTRDSVKQNLRLQLTIEKLYANEATVSASEVEEFIKTSGSLLQSTDSAKQREEAENALKQQKISDLFSQKFQELKTKANIQIF